MLSASTVRMWLGSTTLAGLLLVSSLPALAVTPHEIIRTPMKPLLVSSTIDVAGTYSNVVHKQLKWKDSSEMAKPSMGTTPEKPVTPPINKVTVAVAAKTEQSTKPNKPAQTSSKPVQVAATSKRQVSRSDSSGLIENALSLQGVPYVFGGTSRSGFDCSGYTQYVYKGSGVSLPRTASEQFNVGSSVGQEELKSGDLVFFSTYAKGASHVGIYIGGGRFVHASNSGVRTTKLSDNYYAGRYLGARRI